MASDSSFIRHAPEARVKLAPRSSGGGDSRNAPEPLEFSSPRGGAPEEEEETHVPEHPMQLRDIRFTLYEHLNVAAELGRDREQLDQILDAAAAFAKDVLAPINKSGDKKPVVRHDDGRVTTSPGYKAAFDRYRDEGWPSMGAPEADGGQDLPYSLVVAIDELGIGACCAFHNYVGLTRACANMLLRRASDAQKKTWAAKLLSGEWQGTMCLTEAGAGSDVGALRTKAKLIEGERYAIEGSKVFITSGEHDMVDQIVHIVLARIEGDPPGTKGISCFIVPKLRLDGSGNPTIPNDVFCAGIEEKMGIHGSVTTTMEYGKNGRCEGYLIGKAREGMSIMFEIMNEERIVVGLQGNALASTAYGLALRYAKERIQGSRIDAGKTATEQKVAIIEHPDVRRMLLQSKAQTEANRAIFLYTAREIDRERRSEGAEREKRTSRVALFTPICKAYGSETGFQICSTAMQVLGGYGYIREFGVEQLVRDSRIACVYEGTNGIQAQDLLFRKIARDQGASLKEWLGDVGATCGRAAKNEHLAPLAKALSLRLEELGKVALDLGGRVAKGKLADAALDATPFLGMVGNVAGAWLLLEQAEIAEKKLAELGAPSLDEARVEWAKSREEGAFYLGKVESARFFVHQILAENSMRAAQILSGDRSALRAVL
jgi:alkylation response protein AidB-like acyl-CoA dehydrogenase